MSDCKLDSVPIYSAGEKVLCFHGPLLYEAKCLNVKTEGNEIKYFVHYQGWNKNWDEWVTDIRMYKYDETGLQKQKELEKIAKSGKKMKVLRKSDLKNQPIPPPETLEEVEKALRQKTNIKEEIGSPVSMCPSEEPVEVACSEVAEQGSQVDATEAEQIKGRPVVVATSTTTEDRHSRQSLSSGLHKKKKARHGIMDVPVDMEDRFLSQCHLKVNFPDNLKAWLVDDWDLVTRQARLYSLPARKSVVSILDEYMDQIEEKAVNVKSGDKQPETSKPAISADIRQEFVAGLRVLFSVILGSQLLYKFERQQFADLLKNQPEVEMAAIYGPIHLLRLFVKLRDIIPCLKLDLASLEILETLTNEFLCFLDTNHEEFFLLEDYTMASAEYQRQAVC